MTTAPTTIVYVQLLDEGTVCYRPVHATPLGEDVFLLRDAVSGDAQGEAWEFPIGSTVRCVWRNFEIGSGWIAIERLYSNAP